MMKPDFIEINFSDALNPKDDERQSRHKFENIKRFIQSCPLYDEYRTTPSKWLMNQEHVIG